MTSTFGIKVLCMLGLLAALAGCGKTDPTDTKAAAPAPVAAPIDLKVTNWGPQETKVGVVPNPQPDGNMGLWIQVNDTQGLGEVQVLFGGQPGSTAVVVDKVITIAVAPAQLAAAGDKDIVIKQVSSQKAFPVGTFKIAN